MHNGHVFSRNASIWEWKRERTSVISSKVATCNFAQCNKYYLAALYTRLDVNVRHVGLLISASTRNGGSGFRHRRAVALNKRFCNPAHRWLARKRWHKQSMYASTLFTYWELPVKSIAIIRRRMIVAFVS